MHFLVAPASSCVILPLAMLQAHSFLWHYLWLGPHVLQIILAVLIWRRGLQKMFPVFVAYAVVEAAEEFTLYGMDLSPSVSGETYWNAFRIALIIEGLIKFALVGELARHLLRPWPAIAKIGNRLVTGVGILLVAVAGLAAAYAHIDNPDFAIISRAHILEQTLYIILTGLLVSLFVFAAYFKLEWNNYTFGIALGLGIVSCEHLAAWAITSSGALANRRELLDFVNMATYHLCVLVWFYYLLAPEKTSSKSAVVLPEHSLESWNREMERLLHQ